MRFNAGSPCLYSLYAFPKSYEFKQIAIGSKSRLFLYKKVVHDQVHEKNKNKGQNHVTCSTYF
jgi:hypothetical protein